MLPSSSDGEENFDVLKPTSWPVKSYSPMGARVSSPAQCTLLAFQRTRCIIISAFMGWRESLRYTERVFNGAFMKLHGFSGWGFPWELGEIYFAWHSLLELCARWTLPDFVLYIRRLGKTIFHTYYPWNPAGVPSFFTFLNKKEKMPPESWALQLRQRKRRLKILIFLNQTRKSALLLRLGTIASADRVRSLIILQTPTKNMQELAKEEWEESEAKLRGAIEISKGAVSAIAGSYRDPWRVTS